MSGKTCGYIGAWSLFTAEGGANRGGTKILVQAFRGGQNFTAQTFEGSPEAPKIPLKIFAAANIQHNTTTLTD